MSQAHGVTAQAVHFGLALWPADVLRRFGYDLPEYEHPWAGKWFDDRFEAAANDLHSTAAKLLLALDDVAVEGPLERAPLPVDLAAHYMARLVDGVAAVVPSCYGQDGRALAAARGGLAQLAHCPALAEVDPALPQVLAPPPALRGVLGRAFITHAPDLYLLAAAGGRSALPRADARRNEASAAVTEAAVAALDAGLTALCAWFDALLEHLAHEVARRCEPGDELLERWAADDWTVLAVPPGPGARAHLPRLARRAGGVGLRT